MSTTAANPEAGTPGLSERLGRVCVGVRRDLEISRHVFRGQPCYIVRDPVTFQSHRLEPDDYHVMMSIDPARPLGEIFGELVEHGYYESDQHETFYAFVLSLHRFGFLRLPISDEKSLYKRHQARVAARARQRIVGFLFLQVPLVNPNAFLERTLPYVRWLYSRAFFAVWLAIVAAAGYVAALNRAALAAPLNGLLATENLPVLWTTLIVLKVLHEFGHAYACKHFGGHVPEMGAYIIMFTPCAYVDATAAWGFPRRLHRLAVSLAGMYVELLIAAVAVFVWAATPPSLINSIAYNVIFLASSVTILFNANPLMRYDGYYILSDLLEVPNLRQRASSYLAAVCKHRLFGVEIPDPPDSWRLRTALIAFGVGAVVYRLMIMLAIVAVIAHKLPFVGYGLGIAYVGFMLYGMVSRLAHYLWFSPETARCRGRAIALSIAVFAGVPIAALALPIPSQVTAGGVVVAQHETTVRAESPGCVEAIAFRPGQRVAAGATLVTLANPGLDEQVAREDAELQAAEIRRAAYEATDAAAARVEAERAAASRAALERAIGRRDTLRIAATCAGRIVSGLRDEDVGRYLVAGEAVATIAAGGWEVRAVLPAEDVALAKPKVGDPAVFVARSAADDRVKGRVRLVQPLASRAVALKALTHVAGGEIPVEERTGTAMQPYVEVLIAFDGPPPDRIAHGQTGAVRLAAPAEPAAAKLYRMLMRFTNRMLLN